MRSSWVMKPLRDAPIQWKMTIILMATAGAVLLIAGSVFTYYEVRTYQRTLASHLRSLAQITASNSAGALTFNDPVMAERTLAALEREPDILAAALYRPKGSCFASYARADFQQSFPETPRGDGVYRSGERVLLFQSVSFQNERIGTICVVASMEGLWIRLRAYGATVLLACAGAMAIAYGLSTRLQRIISDPILRLTALAQAVSEKKDYALRAEVLNHDEVGRLSAGVNHMLAQIQARDASLQEQTRMLRTSVEEISDLYNHAPCGYHSADENGLFLRVNDTELKWLGYAREELIGTLRVADLIAPEGRQIFQETYARFKEQGAIHNLEMEMVRRDGSRLPVLVSATAVRDEAGKFLLSRTTLYDITERKRAEEDRIALERQVLHAQKLESLGLLAGGFAHDFNNLLTAIIANLDLAALDLPPESEESLRLEKARSASMRAADLCKQILAFSGRGSFVVELLELNLLVQDMARLLESSISKKISLEFDLAPGLPALRADATQVRQVLMNLVVNAAEAIGTGEGLIRISTRAQQCDRLQWDDAWKAEELPEGPYLVLEVSDNGSGMDHETLTHIFDPFFTTKFTGRGLGLAAVQGIMRGHKGAIHVYSERGTGTVFRLYFPAAPGMAASGKLDAGASAPLSRAGAILLVDDETMLCEAEGAILRTMGFKTFLAPDGMAALDVFRAHREEIVLVIMDLTMPRMDGVEAFRELRKLDAAVPVIIASGYSQQEVGGLFEGTDVNGFIQKPFTRAELSAKLAELLPDNARG